MDLLARLTRGRRVSLAYEPVSRKGDIGVRSKILAHDPFLLSCLHSLMQNIFNASFLWRIGV